MLHDLSGFDGDAHGEMFGAMILLPITASGEIGDGVFELTNGFCFLFNCLNGNFFDIVFCLQSVQFYCGTKLINQNTPICRELLKSVKSFECFEFYKCLSKFKIQKYLIFVIRGALLK